MNSYLDFLNLLLGYGNNLPLAVPHISGGIQDFQHGVYEFQQAGMVLKGGTPPATSGPKLLTVAHGEQLAVSEEEMQKEKEVIRKMKAGYGGDPKHLKAIGDGTLLRSLFTFLQNNPQLLQLILSLLQGKAPATSPTTV